MDIKLNGELITSLVDDLGGTMKFLAAWSEHDGDDNLDKATVHRWMNGQLPKNPERLMRLAGVLDVDPFALLVAEEDAVSEIADGMLEIVQHDHSTPAPLQMLRAFFGRRKDWPPEALSRDYFGRPWHVHEFSHDASVRRNFMQTVELTSASDTLRPQVFHFAYKSTDRFSGRWLQYGFVMRHAEEAVLRHIHGYTERMTVKESGAPLRVSTWFGPGSAIFRVASLQAFQLAAPAKQFAREECVEFPG